MREIQSFIRDIQANCQILARLDVLSGFADLAADSGYCRGDLMSHPERLASQPGCQKASMFFWLSNNLNRWADRDDVRAVSRRVNGGWNGLAQRMYYWRVAKKVLGV